LDVRQRSAHKFRFIRIWFFLLYFIFNFHFKYLKNIFVFYCVPDKHSVWNVYDKTDLKWSKNVLP
jgi:hypothetical protein